MVDFIDAWWRAIIIATCPFLFLGVMILRELRAILRDILAELRKMNELDGK